MTVGALKNEPVAAVMSNTKLMFDGTATPVPWPSMQKKPAPVPLQPLALSPPDARVQKLGEFGALTSDTAVGLPEVAFSARSSRNLAFAQSPDNVDASMFSVSR